MANKDKYVISTCFSEYETAKGLLLFEKERMKTFKRHISNETIQYYYVLITKYLLSVETKLSIDYIKTIIRRHIAISVYMYFRDGLDKSYRIKGFDEILDKDIDLTDLKRPVKYINSTSLSNPFWDLYNGADYETIKDSIIDISLDDEKTVALLCTVFDYFYYGCKFADLKYYNRSDLLIAYGINNYSFNNYTFKVLDNDYLENWVSTKNDFHEKDIEERILGFIINIILINGNLEFKDEMVVMPRYYYEMMINEARKPIFKNRYGFFEVDFINRVAVILPDKIKKSFEFKYNDIDYIFTSKGIKKKS